MEWKRIRDKSKEEDGKLRMKGNRMAISKKTRIEIPGLY
jgi:hypothetical protein